MRMFITPKNKYLSNDMKNRKMFYSLNYKIPKISIVSSMSLNGFTYYIINFLYPNLALWEYFIFYMI